MEQKELLLDCVSKVNERYDLINIVLNEEAEIDGHTLLSVSSMLRKMNVFLVQKLIREGMLSYDASECCDVLDGKKLISGDTLKNPQYMCGLDDVIENLFFGVMRAYGWNFREYEIEFSEEVLSDCGIELLCGSDLYELENEQASKIYESIGFCDKEARVLAKQTELLCDLSVYDCDYEIPRLYLCNHPNFSKALKTDRAAFENEVVFFSWILNTWGTGVSYEFENEHYFGFIFGEIYSNSEDSTTISSCGYFLDQTLPYQCALLDMKLAEMGYNP